jgi:hypothetical protein
MNQSEKELFVRFLKDEIRVINDRYPALTELDTSDPELHRINESLRHLQSALNAVEKPLENDGLIT